MATAIIPDENAVGPEVWSLNFKHPDQVNQILAEGHAIVDALEVGCVLT